MKAARTRALNKKHAGTAKHASTAKHTGTATRKSATAAKQKATRTAKQVAAAKARAWTPDGDVALCSARAVAEALRIATGRAVTDADVLSWYWATAAHADEGQTILDALSAAQLQGWQIAADGPVQHPQVEPNFDGWLRMARGDLAADVAGAVPHAVILGVDWPEPHAVVELDGVWWSWGEPYEPWTDQISEAWAVTWQ